MTLVPDPVLLVNILLCLTIFILGLEGYRRTGSDLPFLVAIAFGLFALSHLVALLGFGAALETVLIAVRTLAYVLIIFMLVVLLYRMS
ncbi:MAG: hypothetical protein ACP5C4_07880 [Methanomicrobiales archaeon]